MNIRNAAIATGLAIMVSGSAFTAGAVMQQTFDTESHSANVSTHHVAHLPECKDEDSTNCVWNAGEQGNGAGTAFIQYHGDWYYIETPEMDKAMGWE